MTKFSVCGYFVALSCLCLVVGTLSYRQFHHGRPRGGMLRPPPLQNIPLHQLPSEQWFVQKLDHYSSADTRTWNQRYFVNATFYKSGGPIFVMIGGEGTTNPIWMVEGQWILYAKQFNAMCWMLEHRYYGKSHPTPDLSTENMRYLSSEQGLSDLANFITTEKAKGRFPTGTKVITFGGSYPGSLSAWFRLKYPHIVYAAVATSAPIFAKIDFQEYLEVVQNSLSQTSVGSKCVSNIKLAFTLLTTYLKTENGRSHLKHVFKLCDDIDISKVKDVMNLYSAITDNFNGVVQYNKDNRAFEGAAGTNITIDTLCGIMANNTDPLGNVASINALILSTYNQTCLDFSYSKMIDEMKQTSWNDSASEGGRQWTYQTCTEFGFYQSSDSSAQPFGHYFPANFSIDQCTDIFGPQFNLSQLTSGVVQTNQNYGGFGLKVTKVVFPNGSIDPWHALGVTTDISPSAWALYINGTAHCANMYPPRPQDSAELVAAKQKIQKQLEMWLSE